MAVKAMKVLKNGYLYYLIYFGLINKSQVIFITKNNIKLEIRLAKKSSDFHVFTEIWLDNAYLQNFELKSNCTIIDIGSHVGMFSILCSQKFPNSMTFVRNLMASMALALLLTGCGASHDVSLGRERVLSNILKRAGLITRLTYVTGLLKLAQYVRLISRFEIMRASRIAGLTLKRR